MCQLSEQQIDIICSRLRKGGLTNRELEQDLLDHFCCYMEAGMEAGAGFEEAYAAAIAAISPDGVKEIEFELYFIMNFNKQLTMKKLIFLAGFFAAFLLSTGTMFKTMHWPGAVILLFAGFAVLLLTALATGLHLVQFLRNRPRPFWFRSVTGLVAVTLISLGFVFRTFHFPGANIMYGLGTVMLNFIFLPLLFYYFYKHGFVKTAPHETA